MHYHVLRFDSWEYFLIESVIFRCAPLIFLRQLTNENNHLQFDCAYLPVVQTLFSFV